MGDADRVGGGEGVGRQRRGKETERGYGNRGGIGKQRRGRETERS